MPDWIIWIFFWLIWPKKQVFFYVALHKFSFRHFLLCFKISTFRTCTIGFCAYPVISPFLSLLTHINTIFSAHSYTSNTSLLILSYWLKKYIRRMRLQTVFPTWRTPDYILGEIQSDITFLWSVTDKISPFMPGYNVFCNSWSWKHCRENKLKFDDRLSFFCVCGEKVAYDAEQNVTSKRPWGPAVGGKGFKKCMICSTSNLFSIFLPFPAFYT